MLPRFWPVVVLLVVPAICAGSRSNSAAPARRISLAENEKNQEDIKHAKLKPEVPRRAINDYKKEKEKHARVGHQQSPPPQHRTSNIPIRSTQ